ncbi:NAD(P)/FAD-dependent oxidoreductase [Candidatus Nanosalina sp. VS9-1]|uniref:NAD(P)/FAD-dependent oxidoreductase n=1 Tax=Candidatus Nanosalina sp. VS9-1 TaxID=3388566 RepID=UPI0039E1A696
MDKDTVVAGGGAAGLNAALELARRGLEPVLISRNSRHTYRNALHHMISGGDLESLSIDLKEFLDGTPVEFVEEEIEGFDPEKKEVETAEQSFSYENLVVALGNQASSDIPGLDYTEDFYTGENARQAVESLEDAEKVAVVGAGRKGVQVAGELHKNGYDVTLVDSSTRPLPRESSEASKKLLEVFNEEDLSFRGGSTVRELTGYGIEFEDGSELEVDEVIWCGGLSCNEVVQRDFNCGDEGLEVNRGLSATGFDGVFAAGGCSNLEDRSFGSAVKQGRHAAKNIAESSKLLEEYEPGELKLFSMGKYGVYIRNERCHISRATGLLTRYQHRKYLLDLRRQGFFL